MPLSSFTLSLFSLSRRNHCRRSLSHDNIVCITRSRSSLLCYNRSFLLLCILLRILLWGGFLLRCSRLLFRRSSGLLCRSSLLGSSRISLLFGWCLLLLCWCSLFLCCGGRSLLLLILLGLGCSLGLLGTVIILFMYKHDASALWNSK